MSKQCCWVAHPDHAWLLCDVKNDKATAIKGKHPTPSPFLITDAEYLARLRTQLVGCSRHLGDFLKNVKQLKSNLTIVSEDAPGLSPPAQVTKLKSVSEASVLHVIRERYCSDEIYTNVGQILIAANPFTWLFKFYEPSLQLTYRSSGDPYSLPPSPYQIGSACIQNANKRTQAVIVTGDSGAGKSETIKILLNYIACSSERGQSKDASVGNRVTKISPLLEAFGNASTSRNPNSSRFGKWIELHQSSKGKIESCHIRSYLLELSRLTQLQNSERTYHIFHIFVSEVLSGRLTSLDVQSGISLTTGGKWTPPKGPVGQDCPFTMFKPPPGTAPPTEEEKKSVASGFSDDKVMFQEVRAALEVLGFDKTQSNELFLTCAAILNFMNVQFDPDSSSGGEGSKVRDGPTIGLASTLLGIGKSDLAELCCIQTLSIGKDKVRKVLTVEAAKSAKESVVKLIYKELFDWLVQKINASLSGGKAVIGEESPKSGTIGLLDIAGFESFTVNGFEQLCINLSNEVLQRCFNRDIFEQELRDYEAEGLTQLEVTYETNDPIVSLIQSKGGLLSLLDQELKVPKGCAEGYVSKVTNTLASNPHLIIPRIKGSCPQFTVKHYAGDVLYSVEGWLDKNRAGMPAAFLEVMGASSNTLVKAALAVSVSAGQTRGNVTVASKFIIDLENLEKKLEMSERHYVRCVKPNPTHKPGEVESRGLLAQLLNSGVLEAVKIRQQGYPVRLSFKELVNQNLALIRRKLKDDDQANAKNVFKEAAAFVTDHNDNKRKPVLKFSKDGHKFGKSKVFLKYEDHEVLKQISSVLISKQAATLQCYIRRYLAKEKFKACIAFANALEPYRAMEAKRLTKPKNAQSFSYPLVKPLKDIKDMENMTKTLKKLISKFKPNATTVALKAEGSAILSILENELMLTSEVNEMLASSRDSFDDAEATQLLERSGKAHLLAAEPMVLLRTRLDEFCEAQQLAADILKASGERKNEMVERAKSIKDASPELTEAVAMASNDRDTEVKLRSQLTEAVKGPVYVAGGKSLAEDIVTKLPLPAAVDRMGASESEDDDSQEAETISRVIKRVHTDLTNCMIFLDVRRMIAILSYLDYAKSEYGRRLVPDKLRAQAISVIATLGISENVLSEIKNIVLNLLWVSSYDGGKKRCDILRLQNLIDWSPHVGIQPTDPAVIQARAALRDASKRNEVKPQNMETKVFELQRLSAVKNCFYYKVYSKIDLWDEESELARFIPDWVISRPFMETRNSDSGSTIPQDFIINAEHFKLCSRLFILLGSYAAIASRSFAYPTLKLFVDLAKSHRDLFDEACFQVANQLVDPPNRSVEIHLMVALCSLLFYRFPEDEELIKAIGYLVQTIKQKPSEPEKIDDQLLLASSSFYSLKQDIIDLLVKPSRDGILLVWLESGIPVVLRDLPDTRGLTVASATAKRFGLTDPTAWRLVVRSDGFAAGRMSGNHSVPSTTMQIRTKKSLTARSDTDDTLTVNKLLVKLPVVDHPLGYTRSAVANLYAFDFQLDDEDDVLYFCTDAVPVVPDCHADFYTQPVDLKLVFRRKDCDKAVSDSIRLNKPLGEEERRLIVGQILHRLRRVQASAAGPDILAPCVMALYVICGPAMGQGFFDSIVQGTKVPYDVLESLETCGGLPTTVIPGVLHLDLPNGCRAALLAGWITNLQFTVSTLTTEKCFHKCKSFEEKVSIVLSLCQRLPAYGDAAINVGLEVSTKQAIIAAEFIPKGYGANRIITMYAKLFLDSGKMVEPMDIQHISDYPEIQEMFRNSKMQKPLGLEKEVGIEKVTDSHLILDTVKQELRFIRGRSPIINSDIAFLTPSSEQNMVRVPFRDVIAIEYLPGPDDPKSPIKLPLVLILLQIDSRDGKEDKRCRLYWMIAPGRDLQIGRIPNSTCTYMPVALQNVRGDRKMKKKMRRLTELPDTISDDPLRATNRFFPETECRLPLRRWEFMFQPINSRTMERRSMRQAITNREGDVLSVRQSVRASIKQNVGFGSSAKMSTMIKHSMRASVNEEGAQFATVVDLASFTPTAAAMLSVVKMAWASFFQLLRESSSIPVFMD